MTPFYVLLTAYILGSIPFGLLLTRLAGLGDIRTIGSGNIGATNVLRTGKRAIAATVLILDLLKGTIAVLIAEWLAPDVLLLAALFALLGHLFPVWLRFKGGKGVATLLGVWLALAPAVFGIMVAAWLLGVFATRRSSVGALMLLIALPVAAGFLYPQGFALALLAFALVTLKHRANIQRLLAGTEPTIGAV